MFNTNINYIKEKINKIAELAGFNDINFYNQLKLNNCIISGSFMLNILNETEFDDIDIYHICTREDNSIDNIFGDYLIKNGMKSNDIGCNTYMCKDNAILSVTNYNKPKPLYMYNHIPTKTIQFIQLKYGTNMKNYIDTFDISVCKNYFDVNNDELYIKDEAGIRNKTFEYQYKSKKSSNRYDKYIARGYIKNDLVKISLTNILSPTPVFPSPPIDPKNEQTIIDISSLSINTKPIQNMIITPMTLYKSQELKNTNMVMFLNNNGDEVDCTKNPLSKVIENINNDSTDPIRFEPYVKPEKELPEKKTKIVTGFIQSKPTPKVFKEFYNKHIKDNKVIEDKLIDENGKKINIDEDQPRTLITKILYSYMNFNNLFEKNEDGTYNKRMFKPNEELIQLLSIHTDEKVHFGNLQTYISRMYSNAEKEKLNEKSEETTGFKKYLKYIQPLPMIVHNNQNFKQGIYNRYESPEYIKNIINNEGYTFYDSNKIYISQKPEKVAIIELQENEKILAVNFVVFKSMIINIKDILTYDNFIEKNEQFAKNNINYLNNLQFVNIVKNSSQEDIVKICKKEILTLKKIYNIVSYNSLKDLVNMIDYRNKLNIEQLIDVINSKLKDIGSSNYISIGVQNCILEKKPEVVEENKNNGSDSQGYNVQNIIELIKTIIYKSDIKSWDTNIKDLTVPIIMKNIKNILKYINDLSKEDFLNILKFRARLIIKIRPVVTIIKNKLKDLNLSQQEKIDLVNANFNIYELFEKENEQLNDLIVEKCPKYIKQVEQTYERCIKAVTKNGMALEYISEQSPELIMIAIKQNPLAIKFAHKSRISKEIKELLRNNEMVKFYINL